MSLYSVASVGSMNLDQFLFKFSTPNLIIYCILTIIPAEYGNSSSRMKKNVYEFASFIFA